MRWKRVQVGGTIPWSHVLARASAFWVPYTLKVDAADGHTVAWAEAIPQKGSRIQAVRERRGARAQGQM